MMMTMRATGLSLFVLAMLSACASAPPAAIHAGAGAQENYRLTNAHYERMLDGARPQLSKLTLFMTMMPKGGDIHHHYSGAIYAEKYLEWVDSLGYCIDKTSFRIETDKGRIAAEAAKPEAARDCISAAALVRNDLAYRSLLQRWSDKDYDNHFSIQPPPDKQFFDTFGYFGAASGSHHAEGLQLLKKQAIQENVQYIETMLKGSPQIPLADPEFDRKTSQALAAGNEAELARLFGVFLATLEKDATMQQQITSYLDSLGSVHAGLDDEQFLVRYQAYVTRNIPPSLVFSGLYASFAAAAKSSLLVGVNIVGPENGVVAMRDYRLHMHMFKFLKTRFPGVRLSLHAGELALGMVPPEGLTHHIGDAINIAGAERIGHGIDIAHESNAAELLGKMRKNGIAVEINLSSNEFILGIKNEMHPLAIYEQFGVPYVISTDDAGVSRNNLSSQYVLFASRYKPSYETLKKTVFNSIRYSFIGNEEKQRRLQLLEQKFRKFESEVAAHVTENR